MLSVKKFVICSTDKNDEFNLLVTEILIKLFFENISRKKSAISRLQKKEAINLVYFYLRVGYFSR